MKILFLLCIITAVFAKDIVGSLYKENEFFEKGKKYYQQRNYSMAFEYFSKASDMGNQKAYYNLGVLYGNKYFNKKDYAKSYEIFYELAQKGYAPAQNKVGMYLTLGLSVEKDYKEAVKWYEKASKQNFITAQCNLAFMYASGKGVFPNLGRAHVFAKTGYEQGNPICVKAWNDFHLEKYAEDKGFKFNFYTKP
ncbi:MAG: tetratricopeptide repeat protein [Candidatus Marinarcus sp.]|uniref:tetratricopeptide repeat protein n=1 Tax=Candidatus Marinarcus sp. TaxID=3100987 RepID=UPI003B000740